MSPPCMVVGEGLGAIEAERHRHRRRCRYPGAHSAAVYPLTGWWHLRRDTTIWTRPANESPSGSGCVRPEGGQQGRAREVERRDRAPRQRGLQLRGRATAEMGRPPLLGLGQRPRQDRPGRTRCASLSGSAGAWAQARPLKPIIAAKGERRGSASSTDAYTIDHCTTRQTMTIGRVNHGAGAYARRAPDGTGVPGNTMEGIRSGLLRHFLDRFKGISQRFLHSASHATSSCTTRGICTGVRPSQRPCAAFSRLR